jgi:rubrerythrin
LSRNKNRTGMAPPTPENNGPPPQVLTQQAQSENPFSFVVPTEFVELPSKGRFYPEGHPLHNEDTIEVKQMTAKEEDLLTSRALLKKGVALERLISSIIVNKTINPGTLLVGDRNAILISARVSGYGSEYVTKVTCPACSATQENHFDLNDASVYDGTDLLESEATQDENGTFTTVLPKTKIEVTFKLLNGTDERSLLTQMENARKRKKDENNVTRQLKQFVVAVNGDTEQKNINFVVDNMPTADARHLRMVYKIATPNVDLTQNFECVECGHEQDMEVPLTADFFWPDR